MRVRHRGTPVGTHPNLLLVPKDPLPVYCVMGENGSIVADRDYGPLLTLVYADAHRMAARFNSKVIEWGHAWPEARITIEDVMADVELQPWVRRLTPHLVFGAPGGQQAQLYDFDSKTNQCFYTLSEKPLPVYCVLANEGEGIDAFSESGPRLTLNYADAQKNAEEFNGRVLTWTEAWPQARELIALALDEPVRWGRELKKQILARN